MTDSTSGVIFSIESLATELNIDQSTVRRNIKAGRFRAEFVGPGRIRALPEDYEVYRGQRAASGGIWRTAGVCKICDTPVSRNRYGICTRNVECRRARFRILEQERKGRRREYRLANRERLDRRAAEYLETANGLASRLMTNCRMRARDRGKPCTISRDDLISAIKAGICQHPACGRALRRHHMGHGARVDSFTIDEIIPGRGYIPGNWALMCRGCNTKKSDSTLPWFRATAEMMSSAINGTWPPAAPSGQAAS